MPGRLTVGQLALNQFIGVRIPAGQQLGPEKVISISTVPEYNEDARKRGVERVVQKDLKYLENFAKKVADEVKMILTSRLLNLRKI